MPYTVDEIFELLGSVSCQSDIIEIEHYVITHRQEYPFYAVIMFATIIETLYSALI